MKRNVLLNLYLLELQMRTLNSTLIVICRSGEGLGMVNVDAVNEFLKDLPKAKL